MPINHDALRLEIAKFIYDDTIEPQTHLKWEFVTDEIKEGFLRLAAGILIIFHKKDPKEIAEFFIDGRE